MNSSPGSVTRLLAAWQEGDLEAQDKLFYRIYGSLDRRAKNQLRREHPNQSLQPSDLINETFFRIIRQRVRWQNREHFFGIFTRLMKRIRGEHRRGNMRRKRGGSWDRLPLDEALAVAVVPAQQDSIIHQALKKLAKEDSQQWNVVVLKYLEGLSNEEIAEKLGVSLATVKREWTFARAWLLREIS